ncbi:hypothetical protein [Nocardioides currus]|uniref:WXG100 family type VII secretion target n=1 Tax=Nocardioides currus TaxID=2133958 RepID=A0A2R7YZS5_9ACTN|nr:hypothetical protein [Nocardioides currus]PUA81887.1 hypothetical protein C7S10_07505 [Nocardioides currus]
MTWRGMDTEAVQALGADLRDAGARVQELAARLDAGLVGTDWTGQDATRFLECWESRLRPALEQADAALATAALIADGHVRDQTAASG